MKTPKTPAKQTPSAKSKKSKPRARTKARRGAVKKTDEAELEAFFEIVKRCPRLRAAMAESTHAAKTFGDDSPESKAAMERTRAAYKAAQDRSNPSALQLPAYSANDPRDAGSEQERRELHGEIMAGGVYARYARKLAEDGWGAESHVTAETGATCVQYAGDVLRRMKPRDPMEEMLITQALWTHARIAELTDLAVAQKRYESLQVLNDAIDRASNTFRRQMLALKEYRRPPKGSDSYTRIQQANIANQQVVQNGVDASAGVTQPAPDARTDDNAPDAKENTTNELGLHDEHPGQNPVQRPALQAQPPGQTIVTGLGAAEPALAPRDRAKN